MAILYIANSMASKAPVLGNVQPPDWYLRIKQNIEALHQQVGQMAAAPAPAAVPVTGLTAGLTITGGFTVGGQNYTTLTIVNGQVIGYGK